MWPLLDQYPFTTTLDEFIQHQANIGQGEATNVKAEKFGSMTRAELQTNMRW